ncbi:hypothetical protein R3P38DRAFT_2806557 [Favolaschia claudopus]|uniref:Uncharacterized protein n=1 Tax=Favolaschia claudopus TaxID=2862362 RepID=A0AAV9ZJI1_9AGAR
MFVSPPHPRLCPSMRTLCIRARFFAEGLLPTFNTLCGLQNTKKHVVFFGNTLQASNHLCQQLPAFHPSRDGQRAQKDGPRALDAPPRGRPSRNAMLEKAKGKGPAQKVPASIDSDADDEYDFDDHGDISLDQWQALDKDIEETYGSTQNPTPTLPACKPTFFLVQPWARFFAEGLLPTFNTLCGLQNTKKHVVFFGNTLQASNHLCQQLPAFHPSRDGQRAQKDGPRALDAPPRGRPSRNAMLEKAKGKGPAQKVPASIDSDADDEYDFDDHGDISLDQWQALDKDIEETYGSTQNPTPTLPACKPTFFLVQPWFDSEST